MRIYLAAVLALLLHESNAQQEIPKGFKKGAIELENGHTLTGYVREYFNSRGGVVFLADPAGKKTSYGSMDLVSVTMDYVRFLSISGDFFQVIAEGELSLLQKASQVSGIPQYNGNEPVFISGTEGRPGDYFLYDAKDRRLVRVNPMHYEELARAFFKGYEPSISLTADGTASIPQLKKAVELYNSRSDR